jgi:hypothetical protein
VQEISIECLGLLDSCREEKEIETKGRRDRVRVRETWREGDRGRERDRERETLLVKSKLSTKEETVGIISHGEADEVILLQLRD